MCALNIEREGGRKRGREGERERGREREDKRIPRAINFRCVTVT
jgi:hypothetical protein